MTPGAGAPDPTGRPGPTGDGVTISSRPSVDEDYDAWLGRVRATYCAVQYTCAHRLGDPSTAACVAARVVAGLLARPLVFRYFGLPFSGRIASLAEPGLAEAKAGTFVSGCAWAEMEDRLHAMSAGHREVLVAVCVRGDDVAALAGGLGCDETVAAARREATLTYMRDVVAGLPATEAEGG